jgi:hypothetical protein
MDIQLNGDDLGLTSVDLQDRFDYIFSLQRASSLLRELFTSGYLKRKLEIFPTGGKRYRYFLTSKGYKKANYIVDKENNTTSQ